MARRVLVAAACGAVVWCGIAAAPAQAAAVDCGADPGKSDCNRVSPVLECVLDNGDGTWSGLFGYQNTSPNEVRIPVGTKNSYSPGAADRGQPTTFAPGRGYSVHIATFDAGSGLTWRLGNRTATAAGGGTLCASPPIVAESISPLLLPLTIGVPLLGWALWRRRAAAAG